jgi:hypothetical protein
MMVWYRDLFGRRSHGATVARNPPSYSRGMAPRVYCFLNNLGWILWQKESGKQAGEFFLRDSPTLVRENFGDNTSKTAVALKNWELDLQARDQLDGRGKAFRVSVRYRDESRRGKSGYVVRILASPGQLESNRRRYEKAERDTRQALDLSCQRRRCSH